MESALAGPLTESTSVGVLFSVDEPLAGSATWDTTVERAKLELTVLALPLDTPPSSVPSL